MQSSPTPPQNVGVFLSSRTDLPASYIAATTAFGEWLGKQGRTLVYGGSRTGLMEVLAQSVHTHGGKVIGVAPDIIYQKGLMSAFVDVEIPVPNMAERKQVMIERSDILVALPGGIGTIDEIFSALSMRCIGYHAPDIVLFNVDGCWNSLYAMLEDFYQRGMMPTSPAETVHLANDLEALTQWL